MNMVTINTKKKAALAARVAVLSLPIEPIEKPI